MQPVHQEVNLMPVQLRQQQQQHVPAYMSQPQLLPLLPNPMEQQQQWAGADLHHHASHVQVPNGATQIFPSTHGVPGSWSPPSSSAGLAAAAAMGSSNQGQASRGVISHMRGVPRMNAGVQAIFADLVTSLSKEEIWELTEQLMRHVKGSS
jgi:hypothetical protein